MVTDASGYKEILVLSLMSCERQRDGTCGSNWVRPSCG